MQLLKRCFVCSADIAPVRSEGDALQGSFAVDPERGRLWIVCDACRSWNLIPIEARWETIEDLERLGRDHGRVLAKTDNIALVEAAGVQLVRVGRTLRREEAWWRYRKEAERRVATARQAVRRGKWTDAGWSMLLIGIPLPGLTPAKTWIERARARQFSSTLWTGTAPCIACGATEQTLDFADPVVLASSAADLSITGRCVRCGKSDDAGRFTLSGHTAERAVQRALAYWNYAGPSGEDLESALHAVESAPDAVSFVRNSLTRPVRLEALGQAELISLEIAVNESREAELLALELRELEQRWKAEEELAAIVDGELTPP